MENFNLVNYLNGGLRNVVDGLSKASINNLKTLSYMGKFAKTAQEGEKIRQKLEAEGLHVPPFLIGSITDGCNLNCAGCFAHEAEKCRDTSDKVLMTAEEWDEVFTQAAAMGCSIAILAGGEPLIRQEVIAKAGEHKDMLFPVITNGTLLIGDTRKLFERNRNLIPVISIEGDLETTDGRRGKGMHEIIRKTMQDLKKKGVLFGASVTVTCENLEYVTSDAFVNRLKDDGCGGIIYIEYVPAEKGTESLAPTDAEREIMMNRIGKLREEKENMLFVAFPGDEQAAGGCLAAGRGFFHINPYGGTEPCPFSPFEGANLKKDTFEEALKAPLFQKLRESGLLEEDYDGGCTLFIYEDKVREMMEN